MLFRSIIRKISFLLSLAFLILVGACDNTVEVVEEVYEDDSPRLVRYYNKKNNEIIREIAYYPDGQVQLEGAYRDNLRHSVWTFYYENGQKWSEAVYKEGQNNGKTTTWYENGNKRYEGQYQNGEKTGLWQFWSEEGELVKEVRY